MCVEHATATLSHPVWSSVVSFNCGTILHIIHFFKFSSTYIRWWREGYVRSWGEKEKFAVLFRLRYVLRGWVGSEATIRTMYDALDKDGCWFPIQRITTLKWVVNTTVLSLCAVQAASCWYLSDVRDSIVLHHQADTVFEIQYVCFTVIWYLKYRHLKKTGKMSWCVAS